MRDKFEEQRWANRVRGIWAIVLLLITYITYVEVSGLQPKWLFITIGLLCAVAALFIIWWLTRREK